MAGAAKKTSGVSPTKPPLLHLVAGSGKTIPPINDCGNLVISADVGLSSPKEIPLASSEISYPGKVGEYLQAVKDVEMYRVGLMSATELRLRYLKTYKNWDGMKQRCKGDPKSGKLPIALHSSFELFANFLKVLGPRPFPDWSLDRIVPAGPYSPENVRWADKTTQSRNRKCTVLLTDENGVTRPLVEWAEILGVSTATLRARRKAGWSDQEILNGVRSAFAGVVISHSSGARNPFNYTPWPPEYKERLEYLYQHHAHSGEHRLAFMERFSRERMSEISAKADGVSWGDEYTPNDEELALERKLTQSFKRWDGIHRDACKKLAGKRYQSHLYGRLVLPSWVEVALRNYA